MSRASMSDGATNGRISRRRLVRTLALAAPATLGARWLALATARAAADRHGEAEQSLPDMTVVFDADAGAAATRAIDLLGGMRRFVGRGDVVFVKPNIGFPRTPAQAANTRPEVVAAVVKLCLDAGARRVVVGDHTLDVAERGYRRSGIQAAAAQAGADVVFPDASRFRRMRLRGEAVDEWDVFVPVVEADVRIDVPVAKHHSLTRMTGAMKNWFGAVGGVRGDLHARIHTAVVDLAQFFRPALTVLDASRVLVRNGPDGGSLADVVQPNLVAASTDQVAIDAFAANLLGVAPRAVGFLPLAHSRGLGTLDLGHLRVVRSGRP